MLVAPNATKDLRDLIADEAEFMQESGSLVIHNQVIAERNSYGNDPTSSPG